MTRSRFGCPRWLGVCALTAACVACSTATTAAPLRPRLLPSEPALTREALNELGRRLHRALGTGALDPVLLSQDELFALVPAAVARPAEAARSRARSAASSPDARAAWSSVRYAGLCVQQGRVEPRGGVLGLAADGFVFERALLEGRDSAGVPLAAWVEGAFLLTDRGFFGITLDRVEPPRRDHADLELAVCELRASAGSDPSRAAEPSSRGGTRLQQVVAQPASAY